MNTLVESSKPQISNIKRQPQRRPMLDLSRGARLLRIEEQVHLEATIIEDYAETDPSLGFNVVGVILRVLSQHIVAAPGGGADELLSIGLCRRDDGAEVELLMNLSRVRRAGQSCLVLVRSGEREME